MKNDNVTEFTRKELELIVLIMDKAISDLRTTESITSTIDGGRGIEAVVYVRDKVNMELNRVLSNGRA